MKPLTSALISLIAIAVIAGAAARLAGLGESGETVTVVHWANGHLMRAPLLPRMAAEFNRAGHTTESGKRIVIQLAQLDSVVQVNEVKSRVLSGVPLNGNLSDPTILSPSADHWLVSGNYDSGRTLVDLTKSRSIARTWIGIVTYKDMAECLGWPGKDIGYADVIALRNEPNGWAAYPCAKAEWGQRPLVAFTDPTTSSTGRSVLYGLYAIAAGKPLEALTVADVNDPNVVSYVKGFQGLVDHYMTTTLSLNSKVYQGPRYGHFFLMPEDNLVDLYRGATVLIDGIQVKAPPISQPMVMIYPREGSAVHNHSASIVEAPWITPEVSEAAGKWIDFLLTDEQQRRFMEDGFRPATSIPLTEPISGKFGIDPKKPTATLNPDRIDQAAAGAINASWDVIKRPAIVTFVVDTSGSMSGTKLEQAKSGLNRALDNMAKNNEVGLVTFESAVNVRIPVGPLSENRFAIATEVSKLRANGNTALYDAIATGIGMTDAAPGAENSIRAVIVLTDGKANAGQVRLDGLVTMSSNRESRIQFCSGFQDDTACVEAGGRQVLMSDVIGSALALKTVHPVQIFFIGIGDADLNVGRILSQATGAEFQGVAEKDLANLLEQFSKYF